MSDANARKRRKAKTKQSHNKNHRRVVMQLSPATQVAREQVQAVQAFRTETKRQKKEGRPAAPHNTGQDLLNQQRLPTVSPRSPRRISRVPSMSSMANAYGSNVAFQDLFDGNLPSDVPLADVDVFEPVDGAAVDLEDHPRTMLALLSQKLRFLADENKRLLRANEELSSANALLQQQLQADKTGQ